MDKQTYVYVTYIDTTPEKAWNALLDPELTRQYWGGARNVSDWQPGSPWTHEDIDSGKAKLVGKVVESDPPRHLVLTWAAPEDADNEAEYSRVTIDIEPHMDSVRLSITHVDLTPEMASSISQGWPIVLSSLKTLLEMGKPLALISCGGH